MLQLVVAAAIPVVAGFDAAVIVPGVLGAVVVVLEGLQQLGQYQQNWLTYRSTAQALTREKFLYLAGAGPYAVPDPARRLAERLEELLAQENAQWVASSEQSGLTGGA